MGDRGATGGAWGARDEASWWPGNAGELQHQQIADEVARSTAAATHQLFTYKMTGGFSNNAGDGSTPAYDYRLMSGSSSREDNSPQQPWWYTSGSVESHQQTSSPTSHNQASPTNEQSGQQQANGVQQQNHQNHQSLAQQQQNQQEQEQHQALQQQQAQQLQQQTQQLQQQLQHSQQSLQHTLQHQQSQQQSLQQMLQQQQQQNHQQQQQSQQQALQQSIQQTLQVSQAQAQAIVEAQQALQQQVAQTLQQQQQTLQEHIQAVQQQQIQAALQRQSATLQQQAQKQALLAQTQVHQGKMPRARGDNKPRGRMTAYAFFVQTCREEHKRKHPDENVIFAAFSKKCAERWNTMSEKEKQRFHEMAEQDKRRYDLEMQNYVPPKGEKMGRGRKRRPMKDPNAPKRSLSAFFWFCNDERSKVKAGNPELTMGDIAKELGRRWAAADPETKSKYEALSEQDKVRYDREMTAYKKGPLAAAQAQPELDEDLGDLHGDDEYE